MNERRWLVILFGLYFFLAFGYSILVPPWEGGDEIAHYLLALSLAQGEGFPSVEENYEASHPQFYYQFASLPLRLIKAIHPEWVIPIQPEPNEHGLAVRAPLYAWSDENYQFIPGLAVLRWVNILIGAGALWLNYQGIRILTQGRLEIALPSLAMAGLIPQYLHIVSSMSNDPWAILAGAFLFWQMSLYLTRSFNLMHTALLAAAALVFPFISKLTVLGVGAAILMVLAVKTFRDTKRRWVLLGVPLAGFFFTGAYWVLQPARVNELVDTVVWRAFVVNSDVDWEAFKDQGLQVLWSFWGIVGWLSVKLTPYFMWALSYLAGIGAVRSLWELLPRRFNSTSHLGAPWTLWLMVLISVLTVAKNALNSIYSQGRFLFPAMGAMAFIVVGGWHVLIPVKWRPYLIYPVILILLLANGVLWVDGIIPFYYQPFLD